MANNQTGAEAQRNEAPLGPCPPGRDPFWRKQDPACCAGKALLSALRAMYGGGGEPGEMRHISAHKPQTPEGFRSPNSAARPDERPLSPALGGPDERPPRPAPGGPEQFPEQSLWDAAKKLGWLPREAKRLGPGDAERLASELAVKPGGEDARVALLTLAQWALAWLARRGVACTPPEALQLAALGREVVELVGGAGAAILQDIVQPCDLRAALERPLGAEKARE